MKPCEFCGRAGTKLCDFRQSEDGETCDVRMCDSCATWMGHRTIQAKGGGRRNESLDYCPDHAPEPPKVETPESALTIWEPWASAIVYGPKTVENRDWKPPRKIRGERIAIHAGKTFDTDADDHLKWTELWDASDRRNVPYKVGEKETLGCIVGVADVIGVCRLVDGDFKKKLFGEFAVFEECHLLTEDDPFFVGGECYGWILSRKRPVVPPLPARGMPGIWDLDDDQRDELADRIGAEPEHPEDE